MNFFQRHSSKQAEEIEPPAVARPALPAEEKTRPADTIQPIHIDDAQYLQLTRALRPTPEPVIRDVPTEIPGANTPAVLGGADHSPPADPPPAAPEQPPGTPIV